MSLDSKVIVLTGGAGFLGKAYAKNILSKGGRVAILDIDESNLKNLENDLNQTNPGKFLCLNVDITDEIQVKEGVARILNEFSQINGLVNNAAVNPKVVEGDNQLNFSRLENYPIESWDFEINVGLKGAFICSKVIGPILNNNKTGGSIVNISSDLGIIAPDQSLYAIDGVHQSNQPVKPVTYSVVKTGLIGLSRYLSTYWPTKVRSNTICPGGIRDNQDKEFLERIEQKIPMQRMGEPEELQAALIFFLSDDSSYINGAVLTVDGGRTAW